MSEVGSFMPECPTALRTCEYFYYPRVTDFIGHDDSRDRTSRMWFETGECGCLEGDGVGWGSRLDRGGDTGISGLIQTDYERFTFI